MESRRLIVAFLAAMATYLVWVSVAPYILPESWQRRPLPVTSAPADTQPALAQTQPATQVAQTQPAAMQARTDTQPSTGTIGGVSREAITLGSAAMDGNYPMELRIDPQGASVSDVRLRGHYETVRKDEPYHIIEPVTTPGGGRLQAFTTPKIRFEHLKLDVPLDEALWELSKTPLQDGDTPAGEMVTATLTIENNGAPLARLTKRYRLPTQPQGGPRYDLDLELSIENLTDQPMQIILVQRGPLGFRKEDPRMEDRTVIAAVWSGQSVNAKGHPLPEVAEQNRIKLGGDQGETRLAWAAEANRYFAAIMSPAGRTGPADAARFAELEAIDVGEDEAVSNGAAASALTFEFTTTPRLIAPRSVETIAFDVYIGPKSKRAFDTVPEYEKLDYYAVIRQGFYMCAPAGLTSVMMGLLGFFYKIPPHNYGLAIIILVLVVRGLLHPITKRSQVNMMKMQKQMATLQPKIEAIKKKYANDRAQLNQEMIRVYQEAGINPAGNLLTCLPLMLQIPIWGALWAALSSTIEMRHAPFDGWWIRDLTSPDALVTFGRAYYIPIISWLTQGPISSFNLLPILLGVSQVLQTKFMPRGAPPSQSGGAPDQLEQQRRMMMFMSGVFVLFLYNAPSGLNLYIMASNFFGILEQWRIRKHIAEEEKRMKARGQESGEVAAGAGAKRPAGTPPAPRKESWLERKWKELQKQAEEARRIQSQREKRKPSR